MKVLGIGVALTALVTAVEWLAWGRAALLPGVSFGLLAAGIQVAAVRALNKRLKAPYADLIKGFGIGLGLRMGGVVLFVVAVIADRALFPPLPTAFGYLGVVIPLLFAETKLAQ